MKRQIIKYLTLAAAVCLLAAGNFDPVGAQKKSQTAASTGDKFVFNETEFNRIFTHHTALANNVKLHYVRGGAGKEAIVLLHGFPDCCTAFPKPGMRGDS